MDNIKYWLRLQDCLGQGVPLKDIIEYYGSPRAVFEADENDWRSSGLFGKAHSRHLSETFEKMMAQKNNSYENIIEMCEKYSIRILTPDMKEYPNRLRNLNDFPAVLYARGDVECLNDKLIIASIGSRKPSDYGKRVAQNIAFSLAENGATIVSGGALGIDSISHDAAIKAGAKTILVMGCGHGANYLMSNAELRKKVSQNGVLLSEYPIYTPVSHNSFPLRNRLISGLSRGVVIVEAGKNSGTLNTARHGKKQGKDIFVVPGDIVSGNFEGSNSLIKSGAIPIFDATDVLSHYMTEDEIIKKDIIVEKSEPFGTSVEKLIEQEQTKNKKHPQKEEKRHQQEESKEKEEKINKIDLESISKNAKIVYNIMSNGICELDEITRTSLLPVRKVLVALTELEMLGVVESDIPNRYQLI